MKNNFTFLWFICSCGYTKSDLLVGFMFRILVKPSRTVLPIIFSDFNKYLLRTLFLIKPVATKFFFKNAGPLKFWLGP